MSEGDSRPLVDYLSPTKVRALFSLYRYFEWADDMRRLYLQLLFNSLGPLASAATEQDAIQRAKADARIGKSTVAALYAFPYMSYYYGGMYVVIEAWTTRFHYHDTEIEELLRSSFVGTLKQSRNASFHFSPQYFDSRMQAFLSDPDSEVWLANVRDAFARWFRYHLKLKAHEGSR